ncbi:MAG: hypothetical protein HUK22_06205 [Thermoguttaceae bacterium]|nr:hypothetical protein [Thermoguttaceae bacterium]
MKRFSALFLAVVAATCLLNRAFAADDYAPLVQAETQAIIRINLEKIDGEIVSNQITKVSKAAVDCFVNNQEKAEEAKTALPLIAAIAAQQVDSFISPLKDAGATVAYVVINQSDDPDVTLYPYLAFPTAGMTKEQIEDVRAALTKINKNTNNALKYRFARHGFIFVPFFGPDVEDAEAKTYVKERFSTLESVDASKFAAGFAIANKDSLLSGASIAASPATVAAQTEQALAQLEEIGEDAAPLKEFLGKVITIQNEFAKLVVGNGWNADLQGLEIVSKIKTKSAADAQKYIEKTNNLRSELDGFIGELFNKATENKNVELTEEQVQGVAAVINDIFDIIFNAMKADGDVVEFRFDEDYVNANEDLFKNLAKKVKNLIPEDAKINIDVDDFEVDGE